MDRHFELAAEMAEATGANDKRTYLVGCVGRRGRDNALIKSRNGSINTSGTDSLVQVPKSHAEVRALKKLGYGSTLWVVRLLRKNGAMAIARPCYMCSVFLKSYKAERVYFSIDDKRYGVWDVDGEGERVFEY